MAHLLAQLTQGGHADKPAKPTPKKRAPNAVAAVSAESAAVRKVLAAGKPRTRKPATKPAAKPAPLAHLSDDQLLDRFHALSQHQHPDEAALQAIYDELARREGGGREVVDSPESRRVDELVARGRGYLDAYAEVHGLNPDQLHREQRMQLVDAGRMKGETRAQAMRRMYREYVAVQHLQAEDDTRGNLLNAAGRAAGIDPATLWSGQTARARKYASDELKQWWSEHGGRITATEFAAQFTGDKAAAERSRLVGQGRDYGV